MSYYVHVMMMIENDVDVDDDVMFRVVMML